MVFQACNVSSLFYMDEIFIIYIGELIVIKRIIAIIFIIQVGKRKIKNKSIFVSF